MKTVFIALRALTFMTGFVLLWGWLVLRVRVLDPVLLPAWTELPGIIFMALGASVALVCAGIFVARGRGTPAIFDPPTQFVAIGPYRYVRNPMYLGAWMVLIGLGLYLRSVSILLFTLPWLLLIHLFVVGYEEPNLRSRFGGTYEDYCRAVPRWIPRVAATLRRPVAG